MHDVYEPRTGTLQYIVADPATKSCVIIDPVLDFDDTTRNIATDSADALLAIVQKNGYHVERILETHAHADHITAASYLQSRLAQEQNHKPPVGIGKRITHVQKLFGERYSVVPAEYKTVFDNLFEDNETFAIGTLTATVMHLPGHTPDHLGYKIGDNVFCGDSLFNADIGTARCDFPGGNADDLFRSGKILLALPQHTKIWTGHDYPPQERGAPVPWMTVHDHREQNKHLRDGVSREEFVALRRERDSKLGEPRLLHQSLQINIRGGRFPQPTESGHRMLLMPFKFKPKDLQW